LYDVKEGRSFHQGEHADPDRVGVRALDEATLVVELEGPTGYFPYLLAHRATCPVPRHTVEAHGEAWTEPANIVTNGPFRLETWRQGESIALVRNPAYHGRAGGNVQRVDLLLGWRGHADMELYEAGGLDVMNLMALVAVSPVAADRARQRYAGEYVSYPSLATGYTGFDVSRPPFDDVRVRRAAALAYDRERLAAEGAGGFYFPATGGFVPPGTPGHVPGIGLPYAPDRARRLLAEAGYPQGRGFPEIAVLAHHSFAPTAQRAQAHFQEVLGVNIHIKLIDWKPFLESLQKDPPHAFGLITALSIPDPDNLLRAKFSWEATKWQNETYRELVETARRTLDQQERMRLYEQAERILVEQVPITPTSYAREHRLVKPWVKRFPTSSIWADTFWKDVVIEPH
jgi:ABC-type oligopeptide transport system substrate-binding subunit